VGGSCARSIARAPKDKTLHLIADNYATHKHPTVQQWLAQHHAHALHADLGLLAQHGRALLPI
jgi:hypothetical protein